MLEVLIVAASLLGIGACAIGRHRRGPAVASSAVPVPTLPDWPTSARAAAAEDPSQGSLEGSNRLAAERLWKLAFASPSESPISDILQARVRRNIIAMLEVDALDPKYFPRRPALMPQLLQAMDDPAAASEKLSRIIAHDPVLTADVLRLANSSLHRVSPTPIESIQRAVVVCGIDALRGMLAAAMLRPVFRATRRNFPRLPRMLWERTERAARAAELYAVATNPQDRFEAQLTVLLGALGPLVVYSAALDVYARNPRLTPSGALCVELIGSLAPQLSLRIARDWQTPPRLLAALGAAPGETLTTARQAGELLGTLAFLESQTVISAQQRLLLINNAGLPVELTDSIWRHLAPTNA